MASKGVFALACLVLLLNTETLASADSIAADAEAGRDALECPGVCPACPGCPACPSPPSCQRPVPPGYKYYEGFGYYKMQYEALDWYDAKDACEKTGGHLVVLNSKEEAKLVNKIMEKHGYTGYIHIGFYDILKNQTYVTVLGDLLSTTGYYEWGPTQPDAPGKSLCGAYNSDGLDDVICHGPQGFLCEL